MSNLPATGRDKAFHRNEVMLFKIIGVMLPFLLLILLEITLRLFHYGYTSDLFIEYPTNKEFLVFNPDASRKYFTNSNSAAVGNQEIFRRKKTANSFRVFVLGESTTIGYPYFHNGSFHRWLQYRLLHTFPEQNFEIINIALTAVNSYTILGFSKEVVNYEPDAVLIYTGHNEYYGTLGVASTERLWGNRKLVQAILWLRELRLVQLVTNGYELLIASTSTSRGSGNRMKMMVANGQIRLGSDLYKRGMDQFRVNVDETVGIFQKHNIPVFISNLVSNEKDLKPFVSFAEDSVAHPLFRKNYDQGIKAYEKKNFEAAWSFLMAAHEAYDGHAQCEYFLGKLALRTGDEKAAKAFLSAARDLDGLRFRAPEEANRILENICQRHSNAHLVDAKSVFEDHMDRHIIGDKLILEHVHPNLTGYALLSDAFYQAMKKEKLLAVSAENEMGFDQLLREMPITKMDSLFGSYKIASLKRSWPFNEAMQQDTINVETEEGRMAMKVVLRQIGWQEATDSMYLYYLNHRNLPKASRVMETLALEHPQDAAVNEKAAMLCGELGDQQKAALYFRKAFERSPSVEKARYLFVLLLKMDRPAEAIPFLDYAIVHHPNAPLLQSIRQHVQRIIPLETKAKENASDISVLLEIARHYMAIDNQDGVAIYARKILVIDPTNRDARSLQLQLVKM